MLFWVAAIRQKPKTKSYSVYQWALGKKQPVKILLIVNKASYHDKIIVYTDYFREVFRPFMEVTK